jgi:hypothetical protein
MNKAARSPLLNCADSEGGRNSLNTDERGENRRLLIEWKWKRLSQADPGTRGLRIVI